MSDRPAFQFYPGDWFRDTALRSCPMRVRGLWIDMLGIMHDGNPYGHLSTKEGPIDLRTLARMVGAPIAVVKSDLSALARKAVFSVTEDGVIYSRRMVRDNALRVKRAAGGILSIDHPNTQKPKEPIKGTHQGYVEGSYGRIPPASASAVLKKETTSVSVVPPGSAELTSTDGSLKRPVSDSESGKGGSDGAGDNREVISQTLSAIQRRLEERRREVAELKT